MLRAPRAHRLHRLVQRDVRVARERAAEHRDVDLTPADLQLAHVELAASAERSELHEPPARRQLDRAVTATEARVALRRRWP